MFFKRKFQVEDYSSVSSTMTVDRLNTSQTRKEKKRVNFDMTKTVTLTAATEYSNDDDEDTATTTSNNWYTREEYRQLKQDTKQTVQIIGQSEKQNHAPYSYQRVMERIYSACCCSNNPKCNNNDDSSSFEMVHLQRWLEVADSRCGLEKHTIRTMAHDRIHRRNSMIQIVVVNKQNTSKNKQQDGSCCNNYYDDNMIRLQCENISLTSKLFARIWAHALAEVVQKEYDLDRFMKRIR